MAMYDEDQETLAAEYVLGTLSSEERQHAEALRSFDAKFESSVQQWERRLGELNVMVEAVEPSPAVWDKVKTQIEPVEADRNKSVTPERPPPLSAVAALASDLPAETDGEKSTTGVVASGTAPGESPPKPRKIEPNANVVVLSRQARRWRRAVRRRALASIRFDRSDLRFDLVPDGWGRLYRLHHDVEFA